MGEDSWLADTRSSYDTVAVSYAGQQREALAREPYLRAALALFAGLVRTAGGGPLLLGLDGNVPGAANFFARRQA
jgi:hypothetical protein